MGRLSTLAFVAAFSAGCQSESKTAPLPRERSEAIQAQGAAGSAAVTPPAATPSTVALPAATRRLCEGQLAKPGRDAPKKSLSRKTAPGAKTPAPALPSGRWIWVNLWAAWCAPCKEEMPRVQAFATRIAGIKDIALAFISVDDDERQLEQFLASAPADGVRSTYWLREGRERDEWLAAAGIGRDPSLPVQVFIDPKGKIRCVVNGAISEQDYAEIATIVGAS